MSSAIDRPVVSRRRTGVIGRVITPLASLELTVISLAFALALVFVGTLAQVDEGLYQAQARFFKSFLVFWAPVDGGPTVPVLPGGYTVGIVVLVNLIAAHGKRFRFTRKKIGILMIHSGLIVLLIGQLASDMLSEHGTMRLGVGESRNYAEDLVEHELAVTDGSETVSSISQRMLESRREVELDGLPVKVRTTAFWPHARLLAQPADGALEMSTTAGAGRNGFWVVPLPLPTDPDETAQPAAIVELSSGSEPVGSYLVSPLVRIPQRIPVGGDGYGLAMRRTRHVKPYSITLLGLSHDVYTGTDIPRNYASRVRVRNPASSEDREVVISMNHPLRYHGDTYFQHQMDIGQDEEYSVLQVVRNPSWLTPYLSCLLVGLGLVVQFMTHLLAFTRRRSS